MDRRHLERARQPILQPVTEDARWYARLTSRISTGCVWTPQAPTTFGLLVTRADPRTRRGTRHGARQVQAPIHAHWPLFAPSERLLTGHDDACRARRCHGVGAHTHHSASVGQVKGWPAFVEVYEAELADWPHLTRLAVARQIATWLREYETVTILSCEDRMPAGSTPGRWAQRHLFRDWLRSLLPLAVPLGGVAPTTKGGLVLRC